MGWIRHFQSADENKAALDGMGLVTAMDHASMTPLMQQTRTMASVSHGFALHPVAKSIR